MHPLLKPKTISLQSAIVTLISVALVAPVIAIYSFLIYSPFEGWMP
jgi:hypothetical protein